jgi:hypothetical protein
MRRAALAVVACVVAAQACGGGGEAGPGQKTGGDGSAGDAQGIDAGDWDVSEPDGGDATSPDSGADADAAAKPAPGNALLLPDGGATPLYPVTDPAAATRAVAYVKDGAVVRALDEDGAELWQKDLGDGSLFGGFDFDSDGWPDLGLVRSTPSGQLCGGQAMLDTALDVARGKDAELLTLEKSTPSLCWTFGATTYPTPQWTNLDVLFGAGTPVLFTSAYYATTGRYLELQGGAFSEIGTLEYPSSAAYDSTYVNDKPNAFGGPESFTTNPHVANGLIVDQGGTKRLVFFTSSRVVQYAVGPLSSSQLLADTPFLPGNRTDLVGRNYGLVLPDPGAPNRLVLIAGTDTSTLFDDMTTATMAADPWGQIERHVTWYDLTTGAVDDRFFSYAHDDNDGKQYEGRVLYPANPIVRTASGPSRIAFDVYEGGHWMLHVTKPGSTTDALVLKDVFLWDIRDIDADGQEEWITTPARDPSEPDVPGYYYVKWRTRLSHWDDAALALKQSAEHQGAIPLLLGRFREPARTTSRSLLYDVSTARDATGLVLLLRGSGGALEKVTVAG